MSSGWATDPGASSSSPTQPDRNPWGGSQQPGAQDYPAPGQPGYGGPGQPGSAAPDQPPYPAAPPQKGRGGLIGGLILAVIAIVIVGAFLLFRDRLSNDVTSLAAGECFDLPTQQIEVSDVQRQPCNEPHDAEVIVSLTHSAPAGEAYPVVSGFDSYIEQNCLPVFETYTGQDWDTATDLDLGYFRPTQEGWTNGDRGFTCYVSRVDGQKLTNTLRAGAPST